MVPKTTTRHKVAPRGLFVKKIQCPTLPFSVPTLAKWGPSNKSLNYAITVTGVRLMDVIAVVKCSKCSIFAGLIGRNFMKRYKSTDVMALPL